MPNKKGRWRLPRPSCLAKCSRASGSGCGLASLEGVLNPRQGNQKKRYEHMTEEQVDPDQRQVESAQAQACDQGPEWSVSFHDSPRCQRERMCAEEYGHCACVQPVPVVSASASRSRKFRHARLPHCFRAGAKGRRYTGWRVARRTRCLGWTGFDVAHACSCQGQAPPSRGRSCDL